MKRTILSILTLLLLTFSAFSQIKQTTNTLRLEAGKTGEKAKIQDMKPLIGTWRGVGLGGMVEEVYSEPQDGVMMGMFRFLDKGKTDFYEFIAVLEENETLIVRLKHFDSGLKGWEEKDKTTDFRFVKKEKNRMYFEGQTFEFIGKNKLNIYVAIGQKDGSVKEEVFSYKLFKK